jgi:hypothetical protein
MFQWSFLPVQALVPLVYHKLVGSLKDEYEYLTYVWWVAALRHVCWVDCRLQMHKVLLGGL